MEHKIDQIILETLRKDPCLAQCMDVEKDRQVVATEIGKVLREKIIRALLEV